MTISTITGSIIIITIFQPYFILAAVTAIICYRASQRYYQASGRELKRLDSQFRSGLYSHFSESLSGLATIRVSLCSRRLARCTGADPQLLCTGLRRQRPLYPRKCCA